MTRTYLMGDETLFTDMEVFEIEYAPDAIRYRDTQLSRLAEAVRPALQGGRPLNTVLRGPPGTGKTTCVNHIFAEIAETTRRVVPVMVNCRNEQTEFKAFVRIFETLFGHQPPLSGIPVRRLTDPIAQELRRRNAALLVCLDDANHLTRDHLLDRVLGPLLRMHETYPGVKTGVVTTISTMAFSLPSVLDPAVMSVYQPEEIPFPPYNEPEVREILHDRVRAGLYPGVVAPAVLDRITARTMEAGDLRVGISLLKRSVVRAEGSARTLVTAADVDASFHGARAAHLAGLVADLKPDDKALLAHIAGMAEENGRGRITSGSLFRSYRPTGPLSYTTFYHRLNRLADLRLVELSPRPAGWNTREVALRYDAGKVRELAGNSGTVGEKG